MISQNLSESARAGCRAQDKILRLAGRAELPLCPNSWAAQQRRPTEEVTSSFLHPRCKILHFGLDSAGWNRQSRRVKKRLVMPPKIGERA